MVSPALSDEDTILFTNHFNSKVIRAAISASEMYQFNICNGCKFFIIILRQYFHYEGGEIR